MIYRRALWARLFFLILRCPHVLYFIGRAIVGDMTGVELKRLPARVIPFSAFKARYPEGRVLVALNPNARRYGENPYVKYDSARSPFLYRGRYKGPGQPLSYVVSVGKDAWLLDDLRQAHVITYGDLRLSWQKGMNSALDTQRVDSGRDIGFIRVQKKTVSGYEDVPYDTTFAFAFKAFHPDGTIHKKSY